jgi:hypothetical protein
MRIATVTGWLHDLESELRTGRHASSPLAVSLRHQIRDFTAAALPTHGARLGQRQVSLDLRFPSSSGGRVSPDSQFNCGER